MSSFSRERTWWEVKHGPGDPDYRWWGSNWWKKVQCQFLDWTELWRIISQNNKEHILFIIYYYYMKLCIFFLLWKIISWYWNYTDSLKRKSLNKIISIFCSLINCKIMLMFYCFAYLVKLLIFYFMSGLAFHFPVCHFSVMKFWLVLFLTFLTVIIFTICLKHVFSVRIILHWSCSVQNRNWVCFKNWMLQLYFYYSRWYFSIPAVSLISVNIWRVGTSM